MATRAQADTGILSNRNLAWATAALLAVMLAAMARGAAEFPRLPALVQVHLLAMVVIMALTVPMLLQPKGTPRHRQLGRLWTGLMFANALITLCFNTRTARVGGVFAGDVSPIHAVSLFVVVMVPVAVWRARNHNVRAHERAIRGLVIGSLIVAGFFTLPFGRLMGTWLLG